METLLGIIVIGLVLSHSLCVVIGYYCGVAEGRVREAREQLDAVRGRFYPVKSVCPHGQSWDDCPTCRH